MFAKTYPKVHKAVYGIIGTSQVTKNQVNATNGTAFMIAPGILASVAHVAHVENDVSKPMHQLFEVIGARDIGQKMETAKLIAEDPIQDIALFRIDNPRLGDVVLLENRVVRTGTSFGSLGFPLAQITFSSSGKLFNLKERFQGGYVSAFYKEIHESNRELAWYETDKLMYSGSSGCPGFLRNGRVFGLLKGTLREKPKKDNGSDDTLKEVGRLSISLWVPSTEIIVFAESNNIAVKKSHPLARLFF